MMKATMQPAAMQHKLAPKLKYFNRRKKSKAMQSLGIIKIKSFMEGIVRTTTTVSTDF